MWRTKSLARAALAAATALLWGAAAAVAQSQAPHLGYLFPAGAQRGETLRIAVGGQQLGEVSDALVSGTGVTVKVIEFVRTLNRKQRASLMKALRALERARPTIEIVDMISEMRRELATETPSSPALADTVIVEVTVAADAAPGPRELRLATRGALTNPLQFMVGGLREVREGVVPEIPFEVQLLRAAEEPVPIPEPDLTQPTPIRLPAVVNGQILPGGVDHYKFEARKGQKIVVAVEARSLIPYLADGVPGWFQAAVSVRDAEGRELGYADHFRHLPDPALCVEIPADGEYLADVRDSIYRGREDFVYRMTVGEVPFVTDVFPLGCQAGTRVTLKAAGWNLPDDSVAQDTTAMALGIHLLPLFRGAPVGNRVAFEVSDLPELAEARSHGTPADAQPLTLPAVVNGRIDAPGQWDVYRFTAHAGQDVVAQVRARRLGSPLDSVLRLTDAGGAQVAFNDDYGDNRDAGLETHHADSYIRAHIATAGTYYLHLGDIQQQGGPEYAYRLRISVPRPDFELRIAPSAINLTLGENVPVAVYALRKDGFAGDIELSMKSTPGGVLLSGGKIAGSQDRTVVTLTAAPRGPRGRMALRLQGRATIGGQSVTREALPAEDMMQAFLWRHLVTADDLSANVPLDAMPRQPIKLLSDVPLAIPAGASASVEVDVGKPSGTNVGPVQFELMDPPEGISVQAAEAGQGSTKMVLACDAKKAKPGAKGNLIAVAYVMVTPLPWSQSYYYRRRATPEELMRALKDAPPLPDKMPERFAQHGDDDVMGLDMDAPMLATSTNAAPSREPEPELPVPRPPERVALGTLPAIPFEIVKP
jgi:hypothetical protein